MRSDGNMKAAWMFDRYPDRLMMGDDLPKDFTGDCGRKMWKRMGVCMWMKKYFYAGTGNCLCRKMYRRKMQTLSVSEMVIRSCVSPKRYPINGNDLN